jgi:RNA polymerase sigma factor (sigma-70 family)
MSLGRVRHALRYLHGLIGRGAPVAHPDRDLLEAFARHRDDSAFATLVQRHGSLVWGVCRRVLVHEQDAEDAFQATFLVLARKAASVPWRDDIGNWLYAVALRVARRARGRRERDRQRERIGLVPDTAAGDPDPARAELAALIDEEVGRLPDKYRRPIVLCCLQGLTYVEAARQLGWPEGTTSARLSRARDMLRRRLTRRGLGLAVLPTVFVETAAAAPVEVQRVTIQTAKTFILGSLHNPASELAEGVMRAMLKTRLKIGVAVLLAVALSGAGLAAVAGAFQEKTPEKQPAPPPPARGEAEKPMLPKEWAGRWVANPFAGAEWFEVLHYHNLSPGARVYTIKDPKTVAAILKAARVTGVQNNIAVGSIATARIIAHFPGGKTFEGVIDRSFHLSADGGIVHMDEGFFKALSKAASEGEMLVDLSEPLPSPVKEEPKPAPEATPKSLQTGFKELSVNYSVGRRLHRTLIDDEKTLTALHKTLIVVGIGKVMQQFAESRNMNVTTKDGAVFYFHIQDREAMFDFHVAQFTLAPAFFNALNKEVSNRAGFDVDVTARDNPLPAKMQERAADFRKLLEKVKSIRLVEKNQGGDIDIDVKEPDDVKQIVGKIAPLESPPRDLKLKPAERRVELTDGDGKTVTLTFLGTGKHSHDVETAAAMPLLCELVEVSGIGQVWVSNQWLTRLRDQVYLRQMRAREERTQETSHLVCRDLSTFCKLLVSIEALEDNTRGLLKPTSVRKVAAALASGKFEALDWSRERWEKELDGNRGPDLDLSPGLGFSLTLMVKNDKEIYIPAIGKLTYTESPLPTIRKAIKEAFGDK